MHCPYCEHDTQVTNSRLQKRSNSVWRRRSCTNCSAIWTTLEAPDYATTWRVSKDGHLLTFYPERLYVSLYDALKHINDADIVAHHLQNTVLQKLTAKKQAVLETATIKKTCYDVLRRYNKVAGDLYKATHA